MAMTDLGGAFLWPRPAYDVGLLGLTTWNLFGTATRVAWVLRAPKSGTLDGAEYFHTNSGPSMRLSFQDLSGRDPDGTADQYRVFTPGATGWMVPGLLTSDGTDTGTKRVVTQGDWLAVVLEWTGTTGDVYASYYQDQTAGGNTWAGPRQSDGYMLNYSSSSGLWGTTLQQAMGLNVALKYNDGSYGRFLGLHVPMNSVAAESLDTSATPDEIGIAFTLPVPMRVVGAWAQLDLDGATDVVLYDVDGTTVLRSITVGTTRLGTAMAPTWVRFATAVDLPAAANYRLVVKPTTTTPLAVWVYTLQVSAHREAHPGGLASQYTSRTDAGAWTQTATKLPQIALLVSGLSDGVGGGGSDPWLTALPGSYAAGTAGYLLGHAADPGTLTSTERTAVADAILGRDFAAVTGAAGRSLLNAGRFNRNKFLINRAAGTITVYQEDDTTVAWTGTITASAGDPVVGVDPA